jgi:hypothetical protein
MTRPFFALPAIVLLLVSMAAAQPCLDKPAAEPFATNPSSEALRQIYNSHFCGKNFDRQHLIFYSDWFSGGDPRIAIHTTIDESGMTFGERYVFDSAHQNSRLQQLNEQQIAEVASDIAVFPESANATPVEFLYIVTFKSKGEWVTRIYDRRQLPTAVRHLHTVLGYPDTPTTSNKN